MEVAFKFEGYRVLLIHNQDDFWDDIHLKLIDSDCILFAVNSAKDALSLIALMNFDIIIGDAEISDFSDTPLLPSTRAANSSAVKIVHNRNAKDDNRWHLILDDADALDQKYLEMYGMLSILSDHSRGAKESTGRDMGGVFKKRRSERMFSLN